MKKNFALACLAAALVMSCLTGCGGGDRGADPSAQASASGEAPVETLLTDPMGLRMEVSNVTSTGLDVAFVQEGGAPTGDLMTGQPYTLDRVVDGQWKSVPSATGEDEAVWTMEAYSIGKGGRTELGTVDWFYLYGELPDGRYRLGKRVMDSRGAGDYDEYQYYAIFDLPDETASPSA